MDDRFELYFRILIFLIFKLPKSLKNTNLWNKQRKFNFAVF